MTEDKLLFQLHLNGCFKYYSADNALWKYRVLTDSQEVHVVCTCIIMKVTSTSDMFLQMNIIFRLRCRIACIINQMNRLDLII